MTDQETFIVMLARAGLPHEIHEHTGWEVEVMILSNDKDWPEGRTWYGYLGFGMCLVFDCEGSLLSAGAWE